MLATSDLPTPPLPCKERWTIPFDLLSRVSTSAAFSFVVLLTRILSFQINLLSSGGPGSKSNVFVFALRWRKSASGSAVVGCTGLCSSRASIRDILSSPTLVDAADESGPAQSFPAPFGGKPKRFSSRRRRLTHWDNRR